MLYSHLKMLRNISNKKKSKKKNHAKILAKEKQYVTDVALLYD